LFAGMLLVLLNAGLWMAYRTTAKARGIPPLSRAAIARATWPLHVTGHLIPLVAFAIALFVPAVRPYAAIVGGVAAIVGGFYWKFCVIVRAAYQQGFAMPKQPQRGSGTRAAPKRLDGFAHHEKRENTGGPLPKRPTAVSSAAG
jgi:phenylacetyl-CoA:acceptor oxidoreductase subunit 2